MGQIVKVTCTSCNKEWQCMTGCGLSHALLQDVAREFPKKLEEEILQENVDDFPVFDFGYRISACSGCGNIVSVPMMEMEERDKEYIGVCPVCGDKVSIIADINEAFCPACGDKTLLTEETGRWD